MTASLRKHEEPSTLKEADAWLASHTTSSVARALECDERWVHLSARKWRRSPQLLVFPWPHEIDDKHEADAWAQRAERLAVDHHVAGDVAKHVVFFVAALGYGGALSAAISGWYVLSVSILLALLLAGMTLFMEWGRQAFSLAPAWERRALAFRRRADLLAMAPVPPIHRRWVPKWLRRRSREARDQWPH